ncbi:MAG: ATP-binding cassette domain-containing protein [Anaerolineae bacterium]|nr:ATP-binding cassette domain-containing protein [Anaerolineae bacterium]
MIEVTHLCKDYGAFRALDDVSFHVARGEIVGFLGPNGAGKTTAMRILAGYMPPTEGQARVAGYDVFDESLEARRRIGYMPESVPLYTEMSVRAYLDYMAALRRVPARRAAVARAMDACHIADRADDAIGKLSKGLRQRVGLAQAILHEPEVLILDEPTIGLDPKQIIEVRELIREIGQEHTVLLSTHILPEVSQTCGRVLIINQGKIVAEGAPHDLTMRLRGATRVAIQVAGAGPDAASTLAGVAGVVDVAPLGDDRYEVTCAPEADPRAALARAVVAQGWDLLELQAAGMSLEDVFLALTTDEPVDAEEAHPDA